MEQFPFTPEGVDQKTVELYALNDTELKAQAEYMNERFKEWIKANFILTTEQEEYLDFIDGEFLTMLSSEVSSALLNRLNITCRVHGRGTGAKRFNILKNLAAEYLIGETNIVSGGLTMEFFYET